MTLNDALTKQNIITKLDISELEKELRVKVMRIRMAYNKIKKQFDEDVKEFTEQSVPEELRELANKQERTDEENKKFDELNAKFNSEYMEFLTQKGTEEVTSVDDTFTDAEFENIVGSLTVKEIDFNGNKLSTADFLEAFAEIFC